MTVEAYEAMMAAYRLYAATIGCTTYPPGPLHDSIECDTRQAGMLARWWMNNTGRPTPPYIERKDNDAP